VPWTSVTHNDLFVPSPVKPAAGSGNPHPEQQDQQQLMVLGPSSPGSWTGSTAVVVLPGSAAMAASPAAERARVLDLQQVQDAALQQVLGVRLQELKDGGMEVSLQLSS
jgi:hypothetical protein